LHGDAGSGASRGGVGAQHTPLAAHSHALRQRNLRGHGEGYFYDGPLGQQLVGKEKQPAGAHVLSETGHGLSVKVDAERQVQLEALARPTLKPDGVCTHSSSFPERVGNSARINTLSRFAFAGKSKIGDISRLWKYVLNVNITRPSILALVAVIPRDVPRF
jgi:hypothetical protein